MFELFQTDSYLCHAMKMGKDPQYIGKFVVTVD